MQNKHTCRSELQAQPAGVRAASGHWDPQILSPPGQELGESGAGAQGAKFKKVLNFLVGQVLFGSGMGTELG